MNEINRFIWYAENFSKALGLNIDNIEFIENALPPYIVVGKLRKYFIALKWFPPRTFEVDVIDPHSRDVEEGYTPLYKIFIRDTLPCREIQ